MQGHLPLYGEEQSVFQCCSFDLVGVIIGNPFPSISSQSRVTEEEIALLDFTKWGGITESQNVSGCKGGSSGPAFLLSSLILEHMEQDP